MSVRKEGGERGWGVGALGGEGEGGRREMVGGGGVKGRAGGGLKIVWRDNSRVYLRTLVSVSWRVVGELGTKWWSGGFPRTSIHPVKPPLHGESLLL